MWKKYLLSSTVRSARAEGTSCPVLCHCFSTAMLKCVWKNFTLRFPQNEWDFFFSSVNELKTLCCLSKHSSICYQDFSCLSELCDILLTIAACVVFTHHASFMELQAASVTFKFPVFSAKCSWHLKTSRWKRCFMIFLAAFLFVF